MVANQNQKIGILLEGTDDKGEFKLQVHHEQLGA
jgi:hypothetical protein